MTTSTINYLTFETIKSLAKSELWKNFSLHKSGVVYHGNVAQFVTRTNEFDNEILNKSVRKINMFSREVAVVSVHCACSEIFRSKVIRGKKNKVSDFQEIRSIVKQMTSNARTSGRKITHVEITHTHVSKQYVVIGVGKIVEVRTQALSKSDISMAERISEFLDYPILLRVITRDHVVYGQWF